MGQAKNGIDSRIGDRRFRFAPSPNGELHLGHACSALINFDMAQACGGTFLLRLEDTDTQRCRPEYGRRTIDDLQWLGLRWPDPVRRQSDHLADYETALQTLREMDVVYPAALSRRQIADQVTAAEAAGRPWPRDPDGAPLYPGSERHLDTEARRALVASGVQVAWRLDTSRALSRVGDALAWSESGRGPGGETGRISADPSRWGDVVLCRADGQIAYHLAVVVDDALQRITDVVRGHDLFHATAVHRLLQALLGLPTPRYTHHHLLTDSAGRKLSKRDRDLSLRALRRDHTPAEVRALIDACPKI